MPDLGAVFAVLEAQLEQLVVTAGTTVGIERDPDGTLTGAADPGTLVVAPANRTTVADDVQAIVAPAGQGVGGLDMPGPVQARPGDYKVVLLAAVTAPLEGDVVTVITCRDPRMIGREFLVREVPDSSAGAVRILLCRPIVAGAIQV